MCGVHVSNQAAEVFLKDGSLNDGPDDEAFLQSLRRSLKTARGAYPPVALAEIYQEFKSPLTMMRGRLSLMFVMHLSTMTMLLPLAQMPIQDGGAGMKIMLWDINFTLN